MICATCEKALVQKTIATKTKKVGGHLIVEAKREALVCECGVVAWDPPARPYVSFGYPVYPQPYTTPYVLPNPNSSYPQRLPWEQRAALIYGGRQSPNASVVTDVLAATRPASLGQVTN